MSKMKFEKIELCKLELTKSLPKYTDSLIASSIDGLVGREPEVFSLALGKVRQIDHHLDRIRLSAVVDFVFFIINDQLGSVFLCGVHVLEVIEVERVGQDVVRMGTL